VGKTYQSLDQRKDKLAVMGMIPNASDLDFVAAWYVKALQYMKATKIECAFVSTNSITQGEQAPILWNWMFAHGISINFAHRTFKWTNEARGNAAVHCVIIGFSFHKKARMVLSDYAEIGGEPVPTEVQAINGYLIAAPHCYLVKRSTPICKVQKMGYGSKPTDGGYFLFSKEEMKAFVDKEPEAGKYFRKFTKNNEFINNEYRYCLWLIDCSPDDLREMPLVLDRVKKVREARLKSSAEPTRKAANNPSTFFYVNQPRSQFMILPGISSSSRVYIPIGFLTPDVIAGDNTWIIPNATSYSFGILQSLMHMSWTRVVSGRIKSDYQYSASIVYNNYPWPESPADKRKAAVAAAAQGVLDARAQFPDSWLAALYDPLAMPPVLVKAHKTLDAEVDKCYRKEAFKSELERVEYLFELYEHYCSGLTAGTARDKVKGKR
jgi:hypothetical protein